MDPLLSFVLEAHGGLDSWSRVSALTARTSIGGPFWAARGWPDVLIEEAIELDARRERIVFTPVTADDRRLVFDVDPEQVTSQTQYAVQGEGEGAATCPRSTS